MKINQKQHITKRGIIKKNPKQKRMNDRELLYFLKNQGFMLSFQDSEEARLDRGDGRISIVYSYRNNEE